VEVRRVYWEPGQPFPTWGELLTEVDRCEKDEVVELEDEARGFDTRPD
jgi:hypothetical protein